MSRVRIGIRDATRIGGLLHQLAKEEGLSRASRAEATYWAAAMRRKMGTDDLRKVSSILLEASERRTVPGGKRRSARYWAANLEARR
jgi:hypothetical protein